MSNVTSTGKSICTSCGSTSELKHTEVYYAPIKKTSMNTNNTLTRTTTTYTTIYGEIIKKEFFLCKDCLAAYKKRRTIHRFYFIPIPLLIYLIIILINIVTSGYEQWFVQFIAFIGGITVLFLLLNIRSLLKKKYLKITDYDVYHFAYINIKRKLKKENRKVRYEFWRTYPTNLSKVRNYF